MVRTNVKKGMRLKFMEDVDDQLRVAFIEFSKWLRKNYEFPLRVNIYIKSDRFIISNTKEKVSATFFGPFDKAHDSYIRVATGDYKELKTEKGIYYAIMSILCSLAHEVVHYFQWNEGKKYLERVADKKAVEIVEAFSGYKEGLITCDANSFRIIKRADKFYDSEKYQEAVEYYDKALEINPTVDEIYYRKGTALDNLGQYEKAIACYNKAIEINPLDDTFYSSKAYSLDCLCKYQEAILCYDEAIELNPRESIYYYNKGYSLFQSEKFEEALECFDKAIMINCNDKEAYVYKAQALEELSRYEESIICYDIAIQLSPEYAIAYNGKGHVLFLSGKDKDAIECYEKAIQIDSRYAEPYYNKAGLYASLNNVEDAIINLERAIELNNNYRKYARKESCFDNIKHLKEFELLM